MTPEWPCSTLAMPVLLWTLLSHDDCRAMERKALIRFLPGIHDDASHAKFSQRKASSDLMAIYEQWNVNVINRAPLIANRRKRTPSRGRFLGFSWWKM